MSFAEMNCAVPDYAARIISVIHFDPEAIRVDEHITGMMIYYYAVCKRKLWYFTHNINMEQQSEAVAIGKLIDENSYSREDKHINIDGTINIDFINDKNILCEVKKSKKIEEAAVLQMKYYLYYIHKRGVNNIKGKIDYPLLKQSHDVELTDSDIMLLDKICGEISDVIKSTIPENISKSGICRNCAYHDICFI